MRELIYYVATTLDGFIAREDGTFDAFPWDDDFGAELLATFPETFPPAFRGTEATRADNRRFDAVLMGRATYEVGLREGVTCPYPTLDQVVFSYTMTTSPDPAVRLVGDGAIEAVRALKREPGKDVWLCGGGVLASALLEADLIDGLIVKLNPVVFGSGLPLFAGTVEPRTLELTSSKTFDSGHALLHYRVASR